MYAIARREQFSDSAFLWEIDAPDVAQAAEPGHFVMLRLAEGGERIPLTVADFDRARGTVTVVVQALGKTTRAMRDDYVEGDAFADFVGPLGLPAFKDCFFSRLLPAGGDAIDGDEHAELEALLACMSAGPVGIGDRLGCTDPEVVMRTCDDDGRIRHVDQPLGLIDACLFGEPARGERLAWASTTSTRAEKVWTYVVALNTSTDRRVVADLLQLGDIGVLDDVSVYDWRRRTVSTTGSITAELAPRDWALWVCAPPGERANTGDVGKYVTVESELD